MGTAFPYQGRLTDTGAIATGAFDLRFVLYDAPTARLFADELEAFSGRGRVHAERSAARAGRILLIRLPTRNVTAEPMRTYHVNATGANRQPRLVVLFYATDDAPAETAIERLISAAGFQPLKVGGIADAGRIEGPGGDQYS